MGHGQSSLQKKQKLQQKKDEAGLVSERFASVSGILIKMTYYQRTAYSDNDRLLMVRTLRVTPTSNANFDMQCTEKDCTGGFNLVPIITGLVKGKKKKDAGKLICKAKGPNLVDKHVSVDYTIDITYHS